MGKKRATSRIYWRERGGERRAYGDFRDFADVGGKREPLVPKDSKVATVDPVIAQTLVGERLKELQELRRSGALLGVERRTTLGTFVEHHIAEKEKLGRTTDQWLGVTRMQLALAVEFFGADRDLRAISVQDVQKWQDALAARCGRRGRTISGGTLRHYLNTFSNLYRRAASEGYVELGFNPVAVMLDKPVASRTEAKWLEVDDASRLLEASRQYRPKRPDLALPHLYPLLAAFLLTGGREMEVLGLEVRDISFTRGTVTFRPNSWRRLKTRTSHRVVPLWPQLEEVLRAYLEGPSAPTGTLLFPASRVEAEQPVRDVRRSLDALSKILGWPAGSVRTKMFRHTYCAARLQTLDRGHPVSPWTVAREMGHGGTTLVERVYGHLGSVRHRSEDVEYRVEQHVTDAEGEGPQSRAA